MSRTSSIVYVNPALPTVARPSDELAGLPSLCWEVSAHIRWRTAGGEQIADALGGDVLWVIVDCRDADQDALAAACAEIRSLYAGRIDFLVGATSRTSAFLRFAKGETGFLTVPDLKSREAFDRALAERHTCLPTPFVRLHYSPHDPAVAAVFRLVPRDKLRLTVQKFFPAAVEASLLPVAGGWSGARLARLSVRGTEYFLKFFDDSAKYCQELTNHEAACQWLASSDAAVELQYVPELPTAPASQMAAFPQSYPVALPVCYVSASPSGEKRETLKELFRTGGERFASTAVRRILDVLATGQPDPPRVGTPEIPWRHRRTEDDPFPFCVDVAEQRILQALEDVDQYGPSACGGKAAEWDKRRSALELLGHPNHSGWLLERPAGVARGFTHGDPNPRNCLVLPSNAKDVKIIDCGDFDANWRLVSDLAQVEREIKLVLMATEDGARPFHDLNVAWLPDWLSAEREAISQGMGFQPKHAPEAAGKGNSTARRAYRLVGMVRQQAAKLCKLAGDPTGVHYFAALLFWTLDVLKYDQIRRTKKLLALYSASEILLHPPAQPPPPPPLPHSALEVER